MHFIFEEVKSRSSSAGGLEGVETLTASCAPADL